MKTGHDRRMDVNDSAARLSQVNSLSAVLHSRLLDADATVCSAESLTGGGVAALLSDTPGASDTFVGGIVSYATEVKRSLLGVTAEQVVSAQCAEQMAIGVRDLLGATWAVSTTGVAGPNEQDGAPVGTVYVGIAGPHGIGSTELSLTGDRMSIREQACNAALEELLRALG